MIVIIDYSGVRYKLTKTRLHETDGKASRSVSLRNIREKLTDGGLVDCAYGPLKDKRFNLQIFPLTKTKSAFSIGCRKFVGKSMRELLKAVKAAR